MDLNIMRRTDQRLEIDVSAFSGLSSGSGSSSQLSNASGDVFLEMSTRNKRMSLRKLGLS
jgi:hypothetical protein